MLRSQMQIKAVQTKRIESKNSTVTADMLRIRLHTAYYIITSQPLQIANFMTALAISNSHRHS